MTQRTDFLFHSSLRESASDRFNTILRQIGGTWKAMVNRRAVSRLAELDDAALTDLGLTRTDVSLALGLPLRDDPSTQLRIWALERRSARMQMQRLQRLESEEKTGRNKGRAKRVKESCS